MTHDYAQKLTSRLCHDLANPVGAIHNGFELLTLTGLKPSPELDLIQNCIDQMQAKLKLLRLAFGHEKEETRSSVHKLLQIWQTATTLNVHSDRDIVLSPRQQKHVALALMCLENTVQPGVTVQISGNVKTMVLTGDRLGRNADLRLWDMTQNPDDIPPNRLHFASLMTAHLSGTVAIAFDHSTGVRLTMTWHT
ncbi:MAG: hypothetical protein AAF701_08570 [Pseudomonadota bacterium]